jgi:serine/threonine protein kinase
MKNPSTSDNDALDAQLAQAVDEFHERVRRGERPAVEEFAQRYPHLGSLLGRVLPALQELDPTAGEEGPAVPDCLGDYRLRRRIGAGGMGVVYEAEQISLGRRVALKVLPGVATLDPRWLQRFRYEAQAAAHLHHPHIVPVFGIGCAQGIHYFAMQFIDGQSLADVIEERRARGATPPPEPSTPGGPAGIAAGEKTPEPARPASRPSGDEPLTTDFLPPPEGVAAVMVRTGTHSGPGLVADRLGRDPAYYRTVTQLGVQAATGLEHAHQFGIVHRDIKPANLLLERCAEGEAAPVLWITDFGVARIKDHPGLTASGELIGTPRYMSPEQVRGKPALVDHRTDIYSLGATLYELLTLVPLFSGTTRDELMHQIAFAEPRPPRTVDRAIPRDLETIILKAVAKNPAERYATAQELADDLQRFLDDKPILARRPTIRDRAAKWARRHRTVVRTAGVFLVLAFFGLAAGSVLVWHKNQQYLEQRDRAREALNTLVDAIADEVDPVLQDELLRSSRTGPMLRLVPRQIRLLERASQSYAKYLQGADADPEERQGYERARLNYGRAHIEIGNFRRLLREPGAQEAYEKAITIFHELAAGSRDNRLFRMNLARSYRFLGDVLLESNQPPQTVRENAEKAVALDQGLAAEFPDYAPYRQDLALSHTQLGEAFQRLSQPDAAEEHFRRALALWDQVVRQDPHQHDYRSGRASTWMVLAPLLNQLGRRPEAEDAYRAAAQSYRELLTAFPEAATYRKALAVALVNRAGLLYAAHQVNEAEETNAEALVHLEKLAAEFPSVPHHHYALANSLLHQGVFLNARLFSYTVACLGQPPLTCLAPLRAQHEGLTRALHRFERAYLHGRQFLESGSVTPASQGDFRRICWRLASTLVELGDHVRGAEAAAELARIPGTNPATIAKAAQLTAQCLALARIDSRLTTDQRHQRVTHDTSQGLDLLRQALKQGYRDVGKLQSDPALAPLRASAEFAAWWLNREEAP